MLFKLPTLALTLALLSVQIKARGPLDLKNVGDLISPSHGQNYKIGDGILFKYKVDVPGPGPAYEVQLQHTNGSIIRTFATDIAADDSTGTIQAKFLIPKIRDMSGSIEAQFAVFQNNPTPTASVNYMLTQTVELTIDP